MTAAVGDEQVIGSAGGISVAFRERYTAGGGRKTALSFLTLILLPFFASLPIMIYQRASHGLWADTWPLIGVGLIFAALMFMLIVQLFLSLRARVTIGADTVKFTLPSGRGPTPMLRYRSHEISYADIQQVELRREVFGGSWAPVVLQGAHIMTKDGSDIPLGYVSEANVDAAFPYPVIAHQIANKAGVPLIEQAAIWKTFRKDRRIAAANLMTPPARLIESADFEQLNASHRRLILGLANVLVTLVLVGVALDFMAERDQTTQAAPIAAKAGAAGARR